MRTTTSRRAVLGVAALATLGLGGGGCSGSGDSAEEDDRFALPASVSVSIAPYATVEEALNNPADPDDSARVQARILAFAAAELSEHLQRAGLAPVLRLAPGGTTQADEIAIVLEAQRTVGGVNYGNLGEQGFAIVPGRRRIDIAARHAVGALYGVYRLLETLGYAWHDPFETLLPEVASLRTPRVWPSVVETPTVALRGFWVFDAQPLPDAFALWLARNRFNLCGPARAELQQRLGLVGWGGGHDLLQQEFSAVGLFEAHPQWYSVVGGLRRPVAASGNYVNPAFSNEGAAAYFAERLVQRLEHGDLRQVDVLNVWPADERFGTFDESAEALAVGNPTDNLLLFYVRVAQHFAQARAAGTLSRKVLLAGISYFSTMQPPTRTDTMRALESADYLHLFYPIDRSWAGPIDDTSAAREANQRLLTTLSQWRGAGAALKCGVVDYHNLSVFAAVAVTDVPYLRSNLDRLVSSSLHMDQVLASMHPLLRNPGPRRLTYHLMSRLCWGSASGAAAATATQVQVQTLIDEFFQRRYGEHANEWRAVHEQMALSVDNAREMFGVNSLFWLVHQDLLWSPAFYSLEEAVSFIPVFRAGGARDVPAAYSGVPTERCVFRGLDESLALHRQAQAAWQAILARAMPEVIRSHMRADLSWFETTASRYRLMAASCEYLQAQVRQADTTAARARMATEITLLAAAPETADTISPVDQRAFLEWHRRRAGLA